MDPMEFLAIKDPAESMFAQGVIYAGEKHIDELMDNLARKIRNQIAEMLNA